MCSVDKAAAQFAKTRRCATSKCPANEIHKFHSWISYVRFWYSKEQHSSYLVFTVSNWSCGNAHAHCRYPRHKIGGPLLFNLHRMSRTPLYPQPEWKPGPEMSTETGHTRHAENRAQNPFKEQKLTSPKFNFYYKSVKVAGKLPVVTCSPLAHMYNKLGARIALHHSKG